MKYVAAILCSVALLGCKGAEPAEEPTPAAEEASCAACDEGSTAHPDCEDCSTCEEHSAEAEVCSCG